MALPMHPNQALLGQPKHSQRLMSPGGGPHDSASSAGLPISLKGGLPTLPGSALPIWRCCWAGNFDVLLGVELLLLRASDARLSEAAGVCS